MPKKADECTWGGPHDWVRDEPGRGEGLICSRCSITEAEMEGPRRWQ